MAHHLTVLLPRPGHPGGLAALRAAEHPPRGRPWPAGTTPRADAARRDGVSTVSTMNFLIGPRWFAWAAFCPGESGWRTTSEARRQAFCVRREIEHPSSRCGPPLRVAGTSPGLRCFAVQPFGLCALRLRRSAPSNQWGGWPGQQRATCGRRQTPPLRPLWGLQTMSQAACLAAHCPASCRSRLRADALSALMLAALRPTALQARLRPGAAQKKVEVDNYCDMSR